jgi:ribosome-associated protein
MLSITDSLSIDERNVKISFIRASGPGGQNVNKLATAVQLRFDLAACETLPEAVKTRLARLAGRRLTQDGILILSADRHRTQERNRQDALDRLVDLIRTAAVSPKLRRPTKPTLASKRRRLHSKAERSSLKGLRAKPFPD